MPSTTSLARRRRPRSEIESDEDADALRASGRSTPSTTESSKRVRTNGYYAESQSPEPGPSGTNGTNGIRQRWNKRYNEEEESDEEQGGESEFQPGAIVRVKLTNFVTYENCEFFPGPNLNMIIGPNGTGKSSLVCAICLGLGWPPKVLGRAGEVGEFVKHNMPDAFIEIELHRRPKGSRNPVVGLKIIRDGNKREWWINGKKTSLTQVQALTRSLSIQIDNLCQFLPQEKVSDFSRLSPIDLLGETQRAAAPEYMLEYHEELKKLRKEQKVLENQDEVDKDLLGKLETRQTNLHADVERLQERNRVVEKISLLEKSVPFVDYRIALAQHKIFKEKKVDAQRRFKELAESIEPTLASITAKESYRGQINIVVEERKRALKSSEQAADALTRIIDDLDENAKKYDSEALSIRNAEKTRKQDMLKIETKIRKLTADYAKGAPEFNGPEWNERARLKEVELRETRNRLQDFQNEYTELKETAQALRQRQAYAERELSEFDTQEGQQMSKLEKASPDTAKAWKWIQENLGSFEKEVYGPPMITCSIKDPRYVDAVESMLRRNDFVTITAQTLNDMNKLSDQFYGAMGLSDITIRQVNETDTARQKPLSPQDLQRAGVDGWAIDFIDGPTPVLSFLSQAGALDVCPISLREPSADQYKVLAENNHLKRYVSGMNSYQISRRLEYGPSAVSTVSRGLRKAQYWTDQPVDASARREIQQKIDSVVSEFAPLKERGKELQNELTDAREKVEDLLKEIKQIKDDKAALQKAVGHWNALTTKIQLEEGSLETKQKESEEVQDQLTKLRTQQDHAILRKAQTSLNYKDQVTKIWQCHEELIEARIRLIEADSDVAGLKDRNADIVARRDSEQETLNQIERDAERVKGVARNSLKVCKELMDDPANQETLQEFSNPPEGTTVEELNMEIAAEQSRLEFIHASNPNAIRDYEKRRVEVEQLQAKIQQRETKLEGVDESITEIRSKWEPELDEVVAKISDAFSYNFEQIGCAGEVSVYKHEDFEQWAIHIKVKFRESESLQLLDPHRQSGGERSVSTIFYLMALQALARSPFRVVDEINQGMDPRNERMVHERMVEIACKEHTSQYFLITPKLLTGLRYDKRMKVHCIASGEHMPEDYKRLDIRNIIGIRRAIMAAG